jgi:hypothetical protein
VNPRAHGAQTAAPGWSLIVPGAQATQATCPLSGCALPVAHRSHDSPDELDWKEPGTHDVQMDELVPDA